MIYLLIMLAAGCLIAMQSPVNAALGAQIGALEASLVSFATGLVVLVCATLLFGKGDLVKVADVPLWQWSGGVLGSILVLASLVCVTRIGALSTALAMILGNLAMACVIDNFGWFGLPVTPFGWRRLLGVCLVIGGLFFIFRR